MCRIKNNAIITCECVEVLPHAVLISATDRLGVSFTPRPFYQRGKSPGTHGIGGCVGPGTGLEAVEMRKISLLPRIELRFLGHPASNLVAIPPDLSKKHKKYSYDPHINEREPKTIREE
jgi:hypothetical protein